MAADRLLSSFLTETDTTAFARQLLELFESYEVDVVEYVCSPITGLSRIHKRLTSIAQVVEALQGRMEHKRKIDEAVRTGKRGLFDRRDEPKAEEPYVKEEWQDGHFANAFVAEGLPLYQACVDYTKTVERAYFRFVLAGGSEQRPGVWVPSSLIEKLTAKPSAAQAEWKPWAPEALNAHYAKGGSRHLTNNMFAGERARAAAESIVYNRDGEGQRS